MKRTFSMFKVTGLVPLLVTVCFAAADLPTVTVKEEQADQQTMRSSLRQGRFSAGHSYKRRNHYWPLADTTPSNGQNPKLLPFAGDKVTATGKLYDPRRLETNRHRSSVPVLVIRLLLNSFADCKS